MRIINTNTNTNSVTEISIPEEYQVYESSPGHVERFLLGDSGSNDPHRIFIFGRHSTGATVGEMQKIYVDGTFSLTPKLFAQIFAILGERPETEESPRSVTPLCYVVMQDKSEESYLKVSSCRGKYTLTNIIRNSTYAYIGLN